MKDRTSAVYRFPSATTSQRSGTRTSKTNCHRSLPKNLFSRPCFSATIQPKSSLFNTLILPRQQHPCIALPLWNSLWDLPCWPLHWLLWLLHCIWCGANGAVIVANRNNSRNDNGTLSLQPPSQECQLQHQPCHCHSHTEAVAHPTLPRWANRLLPGGW